MKEETAGRAVFARIQNWRSVTRVTLLTVGFVFLSQTASATNIEFLMTFSQSVEPITYGDASEGSPLDEETIIRVTDCVFSSGSCVIDATPGGLGVTVTPQVTFPNNAFDPTTRGVTSGPDSTGIQVEQVVGYANVDPNTDNFVMDALHQISDTSYLASFEAAEGSIDIEDIAIVSTTGSPTLYANVTSLFSGTTEDVNAVVGIASTIAGGGTVFDLLVSFEDTIASGDLDCGGSVTCTNLGSGIETNQLIALNLDGTDIDEALLFLDDPDGILDVTAKKGTNPGNIIGAAISPSANLDSDALISLFLLLDDDDKGPSVYKASAYSNGCATAAYCLANVFQFFDLTKSYINSGGSGSNAASRSVTGLSFLFSSSVPEPGSMALVALGGMGLVAMARRKRAVSKPHQRPETACQG